MPWVGGQLRFLATYSCHSLFKIESKAGDRSPTSRPQGQLPMGASTISANDPQENSISKCELTQIRAHSQLWTSKDRAGAMALGPCFAMVDSLL